MEYLVEITSWPLRFPVSFVLIDSSPMLGGLLSLSMYVIPFLSLVLMGGLVWWNFGREGSGASLRKGLSAPGGKWALFSLLTGTTRTADYVEGFKSVGDLLAGRSATTDFFDPIFDPAGQVASGQVTERPVREQGPEHPPFSLSPNIAGLAVNDGPTDWARLRGFRVGVRTRGERVNIEKRDFEGSSHSTTGTLGCTQVFAELPLNLGMYLMLSHFDRRQPTMNFMLQCLDDVELGDPRIDGAFYINGLQPEETQRLLSAPAILESLHSWAEADVRLRMSDRAVWVERDGAFDAQTLARDVQGVVDMAERLVAAYRQRGPWAFSNEIARKWGPFCQARGLQLDLEKKRLRGELAGLEVEAHTDVVLLGQKVGFSTRLQVRFRPGFGVGFRLRRNGRRGLFGGRGGLKIGDQEFDKRFLIEGRSEASVRSELGPEAREQIDGLYLRCHDLSIDAGGIEITINEFVDQGDRLQKAFEALVTCAGVLSPGMLRPASTPRVPEPYRAG